MMAQAPNETYNSKKSGSPPVHLVHFGVRQPT
jgi:hypothetical protein